MISKHFKYWPALAMLVIVPLFDETGQTRAELVSPTSRIISAPASVEDEGATNLSQEGFDEQQCVLLAQDLAVDATGGNYSNPSLNGFIPAGTEVSSHMIFLNINDPNPPEPILDLNVEWIFNAPILGVMSDTDGFLEAASNATLGAVSTTYPGVFAFRGIEVGSAAPFEDSYTVVGKKITVSMTATQPGDWMRVITRCLAAYSTESCHPNHAIVAT